MIRKLLIGLMFIVIGVAANAQNMQCAYNGGPGTPPIAEPGTCVELLIGQLNYEINVHHTQGCPKSLVDTSKGTNGLTWLHFGTWRLEVYVFADPLAGGCSSTSSQVAAGDTVNDYSIQPAYPSYGQAFWTSPPASLTLDGNPQIVGSANIASDWGSVNYDVTKTFVPQSQYSTYTIVYNTAIIEGSTNGSYYDPGVSSLKVRDQSGNDVSPSWGGAGTDFTDNTYNNVEITGKWIGTLSNLTDGNYYTIEVTGIAYAGGTGNHGSFAIGTVSVLGQ